MKALVLSGGSIKGSYQSGAILSVVESGFDPDLILGISTGALSGAFLVNHIGRSTAAPGPAEWQRAAQGLIDFYRTKITGPDVVVKRRGWFGLLLGILFKKFKGFVDTEPLHQLLHATLDKAQLTQAHVALRIGAVNMSSGDLTWFDNTPQTDVIEGVFASAAEPITMPLVPIGEALYYDGGIRSVAPVGEAINQGADEIVAIVCQASHLTPATFDPGDVLQVAGRLSDILTDGIVRSDLKQVERINRAIRTLGSDAERAFGRAYKEIKWKLIQPEQELPIRLDKFGPADIAKMIDYGRDLGRRVMQGGWSNVAF